MPRLNLQEVSLHLAEETGIICSSCTDVAAEDRDGYCNNCADYWEDARDNYDEYDYEPEDTYLDDLEWDRIQVENDDTAAQVNAAYDWQFDDVDWDDRDWDSHYR